MYDKIPDWKARDRELNQRAEQARKGTMFFQSTKFVDVPATTERTDHPDGAAITQPATTRKVLTRTYRRDGYKP